LEKILLLTGTRESLTMEDLEIVSSVEMPRDVFALLNAIASGRSDHAVEIMREILRTAEPPLKILSVLLWHYRLVLKAKQLTNPPRDARELQKIHPSRFVAQKVLHQSRDLSSESVREIFATLRETDRLLKGSRLPVFHIMESLAFTLASRHKMVASGVSNP
jgi:DNA polymerase-3 subunit delta